MSFSFKALVLKKYLAQGIESISHLKQAHGRLFRLRLHQDSYLLNMILRCSFGFGDKNYPKLIFHQIRDPNLFLFNTMIREMVSNECFEDAIQYYNLMRVEGLLPNKFTFPFVLKASVRLRGKDSNELGVSMHAFVVKLGLEEDVYVSTGLVCLYAKSGNMADAHKLFDDTPEKNLVSCSTIISGYVDAGQFKEAVHWFKRLLGVGLNPDSVLLVRVLSACGQSRDLESGEWVLGHMEENGMTKNLFVRTALFDMYTKCGCMEKARTVFDGLIEKDVVSWSAMIQGYASNGFPKEALDLFAKMVKEGLQPDCYTMVGVLQACACLGALDFGHWASRFVDRTQFLSNTILGTSLIDMYAKCGNMSSAWKIFKEMKERDRVVWNAAICGLAMNGHAEVTFAVFGQIEKLGILPNGNSFIGLLCACTHAGLVRDGRKYFHSMQSVFSVTPGVEHYGCMVDLLGRAGLLDEAHQLIKGMPMAPNAIVWGALLGGCRLHRDMQLAEDVLKELISLEPWNCGNYVLLSNIYSVKKKWSDAENLRLKMNEQGIQKMPGYSWIEVNGVVHEFLVGDKSHPMSDEIYAKLNELMMELRAYGYVPTTDLVLFDIEHEEKEHFLGYHSEKLAVAFGLIFTPSNLVIRVVKNLRVCGDCHEAIKLISRITGREIVVRDTNRFHSFIDGSCSCRDYW